MDAAQARRLLTGFLIGLTLGALYALMAGTVDALLLRDLPLRVDGPTLALAALGYGGGVGALSALTAWPAGNWRGILSGALALAVVVLGVSLYQSASRPETGLIVLALTLAPVLVMCLPFTALLRWLANRQLGALALSGARRWRAQAGLIVLVALLGVVPGFATRMSPSAEQAVRKVHGLLQTTAAPESEFLRTFARLPDLRAHAGQPYTLSQRASRESPIGYDVRVWYADGYGLLCVCVVYPQTPPRLNSCVEQRAHP